MNAPVLKATAAVRLGPCLYGRKSATGGCSCGRYKKKRGQKYRVCTCGHSDTWHEVDGVAVGLTQTSLHEAFVRFESSVVSAIHDLERALATGLSADKREKQIREFEAAGMLSPEDSVVARTNGRVTREELTEFLKERPFENGTLGVDMHLDTAAPPGVFDPSLGPAQLPDGIRSPAADALVATLIAHGPCDRRTLLVRAVYSHKTKNVQTALAKLGEGWIATGSDGRINVLVNQHEGVVARAREVAVPLGEPLLEAWCKKLDRAAAVSLRTLEGFYPRRMSRGEIADASERFGGPEGGYSLATKNFQSALSRLRDLGLAHYDASDRTFRCHEDLVATERRTAS